MSATGAELRAALSRLRDLLARNGEADWAQIIARALTEPDDAALARSVEGWMAGIGSLGDLLILPGNHRAVAGCAVEPVNRALVALRREVWTLARSLA